MTDALRSGSLQTLPIPRPQHTCAESRGLDGFVFGADAKLHWGKLPGLAALAREIGTREGLGPPGAGFFRWIPDRPPASPSTVRDDRLGRGGGGLGGFA